MAKALSFVFALLLLTTCATDPGASTPTAGGAICSYDGCRSGIVVNVLVPTARTGQTTFYIGRLFYESTDIAGSLATNLTVDYAALSFVLPSNCSGLSPSLVSQSDYAAYRLLQYTVACSLTSLDVIQASGSVTYTNTSTGQTRSESATGSGSSGSSSNLTHQTIFFTSTLNAPNFGALSNADAICAARAAAGTQTSGLAGTWKAIISNDTTDASSRFTLQTGLPIKNTAGQTVVNSAATLWSGTNLVNAIYYDENGTVESGLHVYAWTATTNSGTTKGPAFTCSNWTSNSPLADGHTGQVNHISRWLNSTLLPTCDETHHIYCINH